MSRKPPDFDLWLATVNTVKPLRKSALGKASTSLVATGAPIVQKPIDRPANLTSMQRLHLSAASRSGPPPITGLDRRTAQRLTRGQVEIDQRLDLHGTGIEMARMNLFNFLRGAQTMGARTVLVITGKGESPFSRHTLHGANHFHAPERAGRLRRLVPEWFHEPEFRSLVAGYQPAHPKHGGGGAFYVRVRRIREDR